MLRCHGSTEGAKGRGAIKSLLIANRGEIAIRIARTAAAMGLRTVAVYSQDDRDALHVRAADSSIALTAEGAPAYLSVDEIIAAACSSGCDAVHPGYGFLSENAALAAACDQAGLIFVGPHATCLTLFGDKAAAKSHARAAGVPVLSEGDDTHGPVIVKALAGGGGRGIRVVQDRSTLAAQIAAAGAEALSAFGSDAVLVERYIVSARHIEVQLAGDATGRVVALGTRDCTLQRRHQKLLEIAPAQALDPALTERILAAAIDLLEGTGFVGLATAEFLVDRDLPPDHPDAFAFLEVNPRLQVEHTVTEEVFGIDLVAMQLSLAKGEALPASFPAPRGVAIQLRINAETIGSDGAPRPSGGSINNLQAPGGPGIRIDGAAQLGFKTNPRFDPLLAKLIVHAQDWPSALARAQRAISEYRIDGVATNIGLHAALLASPDVAATQIDTAWFDRNIASLVPAAEPGQENADAEVVIAPLSGVVVSIDVAVGDAVRAGAELGTIEALKMQHAIVAPHSGIVAAVSAKPGRVIDEGSVVLRLLPSADLDGPVAAEEAIDPELIRPDLAEVYARHALGLDENRPDAMDRRRRTNQRSARENLADLFDQDSFVEYGALTIAAQRRRRSLDDLMRNTPADGMVGGIGTVNAHDHGEEGAKCLGLAYDYTVLAGTQGHNNHRKTDRLLGIAADLKLPIVFYTEGGGGRPGDVDSVGATGLDVPTFRSFAALSGTAPRIGITSGYSFAGNAILFGSCDITIATRDAHIGVGGPAMIEGGGLGVFSPKEVGPVDVHWQSGAVDILADDEADATDLARRLLSFFQGTIAPGSVPDQRLLRQVVPENRLRVFDIRQVIAGLFDTASFVELRGGYARGMITGLARMNGRAVGLVANDCRYLSGAVDAEGADKAARFFQLCDAFGVPIVSLCDTPGFMVGPEAEKSAPIRRAARMFVVGAALSVPVFTVVVRKAYGLGAQAMAGGSLHAGPFTIAWPTAEFGGMGLEGAVRLGYRKELEAIADDRDRQKRFEQLVAQSYERGKAVSVAQYLEIDAVIDPADTRKWLLRGLASTPARRSGRYIDTW